MFKINIEHSTPFSTKVEIINVKILVKFCMAKGSDFYEY